MRSAENAAVPPELFLSFEPASLSTVQYNGVIFICVGCSVIFLSIGLQIVYSFYQRRSQEVLVEHYD